MKLSIYDKLESKFNIIYPKSNNATYASLLNFSGEFNTFRQRWYDYKEGYSLALVKNLIKKFNNYKRGIIMDPFLGSGSTIMGANELGLRGIGFEVNPFAYFLSKCKLDNYTSSNKKEFDEAYPKIISNAEKTYKLRHQPLPKLSISKKVFNKNIQNFVMTVRQNIFNYNGSPKVKKLLLLGWLSSIEPMSQYKKAGNGLKKKVTSKNNVDNIFLAKVIIENKYYLISDDMVNTDFKFKNKIYNDSSLNMNKYLNKNSLSGIIFSPPYVNSFDYTEIYKLELWFGGFVKNYTDLKKLRKESIQSYLTGISKNTDLSKLNLKSISDLNYLLSKINMNDLWDKRIPIMIKMYFSSMFKLLDYLYLALKPKGFCSMIVGNSSYGGVVFPTDLLLAEYARKIGFKVKKIIVNRYIITSSQQYKKTLEEKKYLRESIVCLVK